MFTKKIYYEQKLMCSRSITNLIKSKYLIPVFVFLVACSNANNTRNFILSGFYKNSTESDEDEALRLAAFNVLTGMSRSDAVEAMRADGFSCIKYTCRLSSSHRDSTFEILAGSSPNIRDRSSVLGERYSFQHIFKISVLSDYVITLDDIRAAFHQTQGIHQIRNIEEE